MSFNDKYDYSVFSDAIALLQENFNEKNIKKVLSLLNLLPNVNVAYVGEFDKYLYFQGSQDEVYTNEELTFIGRIKNVVVFSDYLKKTNKGRMACRIVVVRISTNVYNQLKSCVMFEKIFDKGFEGFNVFVFITDFNVYFGCRIFEGDYLKKDCIVSKPQTKTNELEQVADELVYISNLEMFSDYYVGVQHLFSPDVIDRQSELSVRELYAVYDYMDILNFIEKNYNLSCRKEKARCEIMLGGNSEIAVNELSFEDRLEEIEEELSFIKSSKINTLEMLFDADELAKVANAMMKEQDDKFQQTSDDESTEMPTGDISIEDIADIMDDPEKILKYLKEKSKGEQV